MKIAEKFFSRSKHSDLDDPGRFNEIRNIIQKKPSLKNLYIEVYQKYLSSINRSPAGKFLEIGSGAGFVKDIIPDIIASDILAYPGLDKIIDATQMDFPDASLSCICMFGVLHHIPNAPAFFREADRCLVPGGRILMIEPYLGWFSHFIYHYLHHEPCNCKAEKWEFESKGPLSDANSALPYMIFERDIEKFQHLFPALSICRYEPHTPLRYCLAGGLKKWSLLPEGMFNFASWLDKKLIQCSPKFGTFVDIELIKL